MTPYLSAACLALAGLSGWLWYRLRRAEARLGSYRPRFKSAIPKIAPEALSDRLRHNDLGVTLEAEVRYVGSSTHVPGGTSDQEAWILAVLAKDAKRLFEFGTCTGKTTWLWAANSPDDAKVFTLTLPPEQLTAYQSVDGDSPEARQLARDESCFSRFLYSGTPEERKVVQLYGDSKTYDEAELAGTMDLVFVDGAHAYSYVLSDSEKALRLVKPGGVVVWHDYRGPDSEVRDVFRVLTELGERVDLKWVRDTSLVVHRAPL